MGKGGKMFHIGQFVSCGNKGVCTVEKITTLDIAGVDKEKMYYILKPYYMPAVDEHLHFLLYLPRNLNFLKVTQEQCSLLGKLPP